MIRIDAWARKWVPRDCRKCYPALQVRVCVSGAESMEYTGRIGHNSPRNSSVELTAAHTCQVSGTM